MLKSLGNGKYQTSSGKIFTEAQPKIFIARHGDNILDKKEIAAGHEQPGLIQQGKVQASHIGKEWKGKGIQNIITSDAERSVQSARIIAKEIGAKVIQDSRLRTQDIGELAGGPNEEVKPIVKFMAMYHPDVPVAGGESFDEKNNRVEEGVKDQLEKHRGEVNAFVLHGDVEKAIRSNFGRNMKEYNKDSIEHGETAVIDNPFLHKKVYKLKQ